MTKGKFQSTEYIIISPDWCSVEHVELPLSVLPTVGGSIGPVAAAAITRLPNILMEEEKETYSLTQQ